MIYGLIQLLVFALVLLIVWYVIRIVCTQLGAPDFIVQIAGLILLLVFILVLLGNAGAWPAWHWRGCP